MTKELTPQAEEYLEAIFKLEQTEEGASTTKDSWMISAFQWALDPDGNPETTVDVPDVINNSYGTTGEYNEDICRQLMWRMIDRVEAEAFKRGYAFAAGFGAIILLQLVMFKRSGELI